MYGILLFVCGVEFYVTVYIVNVSGYGVKADFCCIEYDRNIIYVSCIICYNLSVYKSLIF